MTAKDIMLSQYEINNTEQLLDIYWWPEKKWIQHGLRKVNSTEFCLFNYYEWEK